MDHNCISKAVIRQINPPNKNSAYIMEEIITQNGLIKWALEIPRGYEHRREEWIPGYYGNKTRVPQNADKIQFMVNQAVIYCTESLFCNTPAFVKHVQQERDYWKSFSTMESCCIRFFSIRLRYSPSSSSFFLSEMALGISRSSIRLLELSWFRVAEVLLL